MLNVVADGAARAAYDEEWRRTCMTKRKYDDDEAERALRRMRKAKVSGWERLHIYGCRYCLGSHLGRRTGQSWERR